jgi:hypothetical protein
MFLGNPDCVSALLYDPGGPTASGLCDGAARPGGGLKDAFNLGQEAAVAT